ncbi:MAG: TonB-dependent receptor plug domain-containing protein [Bacteroidota bacterium]
MKKFIYSAVLLLLMIPMLHAQEKYTDTLTPVTMKEIILIGQKPKVSQKISKPLASIDEYLESSSKVTMIKRGAYAWEPMINGMATERTVITIDGMRIFGACTDKMDPITSYVEISNLSEASISSGQQGAEHGATIGGSIDLKRRKTGFKGTGWKVAVNTGGESNGEQKIAGTELQYANDSFYINTDFMYRDAENYKAGGNREVLYSQFTKYNFSAISGFKLSETQSIEGSFIYDEANDVGYPALPMDVSLARAFIGSLKYEVHQPLEFIKHWESKLYFNSITHQMDDSKRPDVPIRMDMPGWSDTYGFYSKVNMSLDKHRLTANINSFYNKSLAEMTMFPDDPNERDMFMLTWPDVRTLYTGVYLEDLIALNDHYSLQFTTSLGRHNNEVTSAFGLQSLQIFYPEMTDTKERYLKSFSSQVQLHHKKMDYTLGAGYGERAPSVSEGYGFYLFNSFDGFDYIGNPHMSNEKSFEINSSVGFENEKWNAMLTGSYFHILDYIIGKPDFSLSPMTIGANGIKIYEQLEYASLFNADLFLGYALHKNWNWNGKLMFNYGRDNNNRNLPLVQPLSYQTSLQFRKGSFAIETSFLGATKQRNFSPEFGENETAAYSIVNLSASKTGLLNQQNLIVKLGAENLFDTYYSSFSDWNNIPRRGRNLFLNLNYTIQ